MRTPREESGPQLPERGGDPPQKPGLPPLSALGTLGGAGLGLSPFFLPDPCSQGGKGLGLRV